MASVHLTPMHPCLNDTAATGGIVVLEHTWGHPPGEGPLSPPFDLIVACDVMYIAEAVPDLVSTLVALCAPWGQVLLAHGRNRGGEIALLAQVCGTPNAGGDRGGKAE